MVRKLPPAAAASTQRADEPNSKAGAPPLPDRKPAAEKASPTWTGEVVEVPVHVHVMNKGERKENGNVTDTLVELQMKQLNDAYSPHGFHFKLASTDRVTNPAWYEPDDEEPDATQQMKTMVRTGGLDHLNLYVLEVGENALGEATLPWMSHFEPANDGVMVRAGSLPGGGIEHFDDGDTTVHEVGHWLGLFHTFENGCNTPGDEIGDTPAEESPTNGTNDKRDTCKLQPGRDPVHNYMDYSYDANMYEFTPEQAARMHQHWNAYRSPNSEVRAGEAGSLNLRIKDRHAVESTVTIGADLKADSMKLLVNIEDTTPRDRLLGKEDPRKGPAVDAPEDLRVTLRSPSGKEVVVMDRAKTEYNWMMLEVSKLFPNEPTKGDWTLRVEDTRANTEEGSLKEWYFMVGGPKK